MYVPALSAKPPSPVQIRAAPPNFTEELRDFRVKQRRRVVQYEKTHGLWADGRCGRGSVAGKRVESSDWSRYQKAADDDSPKSAVELIRAARVDERWGTPSGGCRARQLR